MRYILKSMNKINLKDTTFLIPVRIDHQDRLDNLDLVLDYLNYHLDTNIIVYEESEKPMAESIINDRAYYFYMYSSSKHFHRTKVINEMINISDTPVVVTYDSDVVLRPEQYEWSQKEILENRFDVVYPYCGWFCSIPRHLIDSVKRSMNLNCIDYTKFNSRGHSDSLGAAIFFNKDVYINGGMENENFINYGWEDDERYNRFKILGYRICRYPKDNIIHFYHYRGNNSLLNHEFSDRNKKEVEKIKRMNKSELEKYISTWEWVKDKNESTTGKVDLKDVTFIIPFTIDHKDRENNLNLLIDYLNYHFFTNIIIGEFDCSPKFLSSVKGRCEYRFIKKDVDFFHKTKILNILIKESVTDIVISNDSDILIKPEDYILAINEIRENRFKFAIPYSGELADVPKKYHSFIEKNKKLSCDSFLNYISKLRAPGGCFILSKKEFIKCGMENQYFRSYGPEDVERNYRVSKFGYNIFKSSGFAIHLQHNRGIDSGSSNKYYLTNVHEYDKIKSYDLDRLKHYIMTWPWIGGDGPEEPKMVYNIEGVESRSENIKKKYGVKRVGIRQKPLVSITKTVPKSKRLVSMAERRRLQYKEIRERKNNIVKNVDKFDLKSINSLHSNNVDKFDLKSINSLHSNNVFYKNTILMASNIRCSNTTVNRIKELISCSNMDLIDRIIVFNLGLDTYCINMIKNVHLKVEVLELPDLDRTFYDGYLNYDNGSWKPYILFESRKISKNVLWISNNVKILKDVSCVFDIINNTGIFVVMLENYKNKNFISNDCLILMNCTTEELNGSQIYGSVIGYNTKSRFLNIFEETFRYSKIKKCISGNNNNHRGDQTIYSILSIRNNVNYQSYIVYGEWRESKLDGSQVFFHTGETL